MKASMAHDPDTPRFHEAMSGEHRYGFLAVMGKQIEELYQKNNYKAAKKTSIPRGANILPSTWALKIKQYPYGRPGFALEENVKLKNWTILSRMHQLRHGQPIKW